MKRRKMFWSIVLPAMCALTAVSCGGSAGGAGIAGKSVTGTAAIGSPIIGTVNIKGADGKVSYSAINADGSYQVDVSALTAPFLIFAEGTVGNRTVRLYSTISAPGRANVTPATNLAMTLALKADPSTVYPPADIKQDGKTLTAAPSESDIENAKQTVQNILKNVFSNLNVPSTFDIMNGTFTADGTGFDKLLDAVKMDVSTAAGGSPVITMSDASSGTVIYAQDAQSGQVTTDNTDKMADTITASAAMIDQVKELLLKKAQYYSDHSSPDATFKANMLSLMADDYIVDGRKSGEDVDDMLTCRQDMSGVTYSIKSVAIGDSIRDYTLDASSITVSSGTCAGQNTLNAGTAACLGANFKAVRVCFDLLSTKGSVSQTSREVEYCVQKSDGAAWKLWGNRNISPDSEFSVRMQRVIRPEWNTTAQRYEQTDAITSGYSLYCRDTGNVMRTTYGITAILVLGEGITTEYASGKKGILMAPSSAVSTDYSAINVSLYSWNRVYGEPQGLDISSIRNPGLTIVGLAYDSTAKTFTPKYCWYADMASGRPLSIKSGELTSDCFPTLGLTSTKLSDYGITNGLWPSNWSTQVSWTAPGSSGMTYNWCDYWFSGYPLGTSGNADTSQTITESSPDGFEASGNAFTMARASDSKIYKVNSANANVTYVDASGREYLTSYSITGWQ